MIKSALAVFAALAMLVATPSTAYYNPVLTMYQYDYVDSATRAEIDCIATNIYFEARNQKLKGRLAVGLVTMARVDDPAFPNTACGVVQEKKRRKDNGKIVCQFSWWCTAKLRTKAINQRFTEAEREVYEDIRDLATWIYHNYSYIEDITYGATFYHATYVRPKWRNVKKTVRIEDHIFYCSTLNQFACGKPIATVADRSAERVHHSNANSRNSL